VAVGSLFGGEPPPPGGWLARLERHPLHAARRATPPSLIAVPPGTVHALLAGALVWEVQTPVDVTWRLDDHGRVGLDGRPRALHLDEAAEVLRRGPEFEACLGEDGLRLEGRRIGVAAHRPGTWDPAGDVAAVRPRGGEVRWRGPGRREEALAVPAGRTVVLPDATKRVESDGWAFSACVRR
jgi:hypothetical protein